MLIYNPQDNTFSVYDGTTEQLTNLPVVGIRNIKSDTVILKNNELGRYNNKLAIGNGIDQFKDLEVYETLSTIEAELDTKVDKVAGKALSDNNFTDALKDKLEHLGEGAHPLNDPTTGIESSNQTPGFGETFQLSQVISDELGHVSSQTTRTVTIPNTSATTTSKGLVQVGSNLTVTDGTISISNANALAALNSGSDTTKYLRNDGSWTVPYTHPSYNTTTGIESSNQTPGFGGTFNISQVSSDATGHISSQTTRTVTIPNTSATTTSKGLVQVGSNITVSSGTISISNANALAALNSGSDTTKYLRNDGSWAVPYTHPSYNPTTGIESSNQTPGFGSTFNLSQVVSNATGHITSQTTRTVKIPNTAATASALGLVKVGSNITVSSGTISVSKTNALTALGYSSTDTSNEYLKKNGVWTEIDPSLSDFTYYVATSGNDSTGTGTTSAPFKTISGAYAKLPNNCRNVTIIVGDGTYTESAMINLYKNISKLTITTISDSADVTIQTSSASDSRLAILNIYNCGKVHINNIKFNRLGYITDGTYCIYIDNASFNITGCSFLNCATGVYSSNANGQINTCTFTTNTTAIYAVDASTVTSINNTSSSTSYGIIADGAIVINYGKTLLGTVSNTMRLNYGQIFNHSGISDIVIDAMELTGGYVASNGETDEDEAKGAYVCSDDIKERFTVGFRVNDDGEIMLGLDGFEYDEDLSRFAHVMPND